MYSHNPTRFPEPVEKDRLNKYKAPGFVELEEGDTVMDVGAFIGHFTIPASKIGKKIISIEPDPENRYYLEKNTKTLDNVTVLNKAAWNEDTELTLKRPDKKGMASDASLLNPSGSAGLEEEYPVEAARIDSLAPKIGIDTIDFLKMDGEGVEPEILEGCENIKIRKVAVAASKERNGEDTIEPVKDILEQQGYETKVSSELDDYSWDNPYIVFGKL